MVRIVKEITIRRARQYQSPGLPEQMKSARYKSLAGHATTFSEQKSVIALLLLALIAGVARIGCGVEPIGFLGLCNGCERFHPVQSEHVLIVIHTVRPLADLLPSTHHDQTI
jgi:hypothetical protein